MGTRSILATGIAAFILLGLTVGLMVGLSESPVVGIVIPALFSLFGGAGGFYFSKKEFKSPEGRASICLVSLAIGSLCLGQIAGLCLGMRERSNTRSWSLLSVDPDILLEDGQEGVVALDWILLDARLHAMGFTLDERGAIVRAFKTHAALRSRASFSEEITSLSEFYADLVPGEGVVQYGKEWASILTRLRTLDWRAPRKLSQVL